MTPEEKAEAAPDNDPGDAESKEQSDSGKTEPETIREVSADGDKSPTAVDEKSTDGKDRSDQNEDKSKPEEPGESQESDDKKTDTPPVPDEKPDVEDDKPPVENQAEEAVKEGDDQAVEPKSPEKPESTKVSEDIEDTKPGKEKDDATKPGKEKDDAGAESAEKKDVSGSPDVSKPADEKETAETKAGMKKEEDVSGSPDVSKPADEKEAAETKASVKKEEDVSGSPDVSKPADEKETAETKAGMKKEEDVSGSPDVSKPADEKEAAETKAGMKKEEDVSGARKGKGKKKAGKGKKSEKKQEKKEIEFPPLEEDPSIYKVDELEILSRVDIVLKLIRKHEDFISRFQEELKGDLTVSPEETAEMKREKEERDRLNLDVAGLKDQRSKYRSSNKSLSKEFIELIEMQEHFKLKKADITIHTRYWKDLEWKLETEAIDSDTERRLMDDIRSTVDQIRNIADGYTPEEVKAKLTGIDREIKENLEKIESYHHKMLDIVNESQKHHERYLEISKKIKEMDGRKGWLTRRIALHEEMKKFWEGQTGTAEQLDTEEGKRTIEMIRDELLKLADERNPPRRQKDRKPRKDASREGGKADTAGKHKQDGASDPKVTEEKETETADVKEEPERSDSPEKPDKPGIPETPSEEKPPETGKQDGDAGEAAAGPSGPEVAE